MNIELQRINDETKLEGVNRHGAKVVIDGSSSENDGSPGISPMEMVLMGVGGCSSMDVLSILKKQKQVVEDYKVLVNSKRSEEIPKVFEHIHVKYIFKGDLNPKKVERAIALSMEKYCSVSIMIEKTAKIDWSFEIEK